MKLDPRIKSLSDILTPFDVEKAKQLIGQKGFFANSIDCFREGEPHCVYGTLTRVFSHKDQVDPYLKMEGGDLYSFFIPESSLKPEEKKPEEKKLRPYTLEEFMTIFPIGKPIKFRAKEAADKVHLQFVLVGYREYGGDINIYIGTYPFTLNELFEDYEWYDDAAGDWRPFAWR